MNEIKRHGLEKFLVDLQETLSLLKQGLKNAWKFYLTIFFNFRRFFEIFF